ncbi:response regulator transcription factor [Enterococcus saccharolyticus]|nr:response regulator transcription factor [Enterococcus saccharolyticus]
MYKVMLVDDEYMILEGLKQILPWENLGFEIVKTARNANEAFAYLSEHTIDLLVTDITMPEMNGIELVRTAQLLGYHFSTIILSGYQEFEYVKKGMQLGVKNYLVKPVDKQELLETVQKIKEDFIEQHHLEAQQQAYLETSLIRWLNDELNEREFQELMEAYELGIKGPYIAVQVSGSVSLLENITDCLIKDQQQLLLTNWIHTEGHLVWIYQGTHQDLTAYLLTIEKELGNQLEWLIGEMVDEWQNVYESFEKIQQIAAMKNFYPDLLPTSQLELTGPRKVELSFLSFNQALMIGDSKTIECELTTIFDEMVSHHYDPEDARYIVFFLFTDIARQYPTITNSLYDETIQGIRNSQTINELHHLLESLLLKLKAEVIEKPFSDIVQKVVDYVQSDYQQDLNLKMIADELYLNVVYLGQLFKKETRYSFSQYLNHVRIRKAQQLLLNTGKTINEISEEIGYNNTNYFSKMFKKLNGITPKDFREQYHGEYTVLLRK